MAPLRVPNILHLLALDGVLQMHRLSLHLISPQSPSPAHTSSSSPDPHVQRFASHFIRDVPLTGTTHSKCPEPNSLLPPNKAPAKASRRDQQCHPAGFPARSHPLAVSTVSAERSSLQPHMTLAQDLFAICPNPSKSLLQVSLSSTGPSQEAPTLLRS